jgi:hypothetical protein
LNDTKSTTSALPQSRDKIMLLAGYSYIVLFVLLFVVKSLIPQGQDGWSDPPIYDYFIWLGLGVCISIIGIGYSYSAWTKNAKNYVEWFLDLSVKKTQWQVELMTNNPKLSLWLARIFAPFISLFGIGLIGYISFLIVSFMFGQ